MMYKAIAALHFDGSSTPNHAKETETPTIAKNIVIFGLFILSQYLEIVIDDQANKRNLTSTSHNLPRIQ